MKPYLLAAALLAATPAFAQTPPAAPVPAPDQVVRQYVVNNDATDWMFDGGWGWMNGTLTHYPGAPGKATPVATPPLEAGKFYEITVVLSNRTRGRVNVGFDTHTFGFAGDAMWVEGMTVTNPDAKFNITTTADYDGSIDRVAVVQLGDDLIPTSTFTAAGNWSPLGKNYAHTTGDATPLVLDAALQEGHTYQVAFRALNPVDAPVLQGQGSVRVGGVPIGWFSQQGGPTFVWRFKATANSLITFVPSEANDGVTGYNGTLADFSLREVISDPPPATPSTTQQ